jgi:predicted RNA-binding protein YlxR (DUF448 family)
LLRVVRSPSGEVALDPGGRRDGRGAYVCRDIACITTAMTRGALGRALATTVPAELREALAAAAQTSIEGGARGQE